jgi:hypothetical protein
MTHTQTPIHVSSNFFAKAARYFSNFGSAVTEILQNAYRASLPIETTGVRPRVDVCVDTDPTGVTTLTVRDYGKGITDIGAALSIAVSGWDDSVEREQDPAGMGLCAALAFSERAVIVSKFGTIEIHGKAFFNDPEYRDDLLNHIDPHWDCEGVEITLHGIPSDSEVIRVVEETAFYHAALDIYMRKPGQPEQVKVRTFRDCFQHMQGSDKKPFNFRGYEIYRDTGGGSRGFYPGDGELGVIWHGQRIQVKLNARELKRHFKFDDVEFDTTPEIRSARGWCVAIDHGAAPVTPKLPDRGSLILDAKTVEFIWGIYESLFMSEVTELRELFKTRAIQYEKGKLTFSEVCYRSRDDNHELQPEVFQAFYAHYIGAPKVLWPVARGDDSSELEVALLPRGERVAELAPMIALRTQDNQVLIESLDDSCLADASDVSVRFNFPADLSSWKLREGREGKLMGCHDIAGTAVPNGVCVSVRGIHGMDDPHGAQVALMVIDIPCKLADIATNRWCTRPQDMRVNSFIRLDDGVKGQILFFDVDTDPASDDVLEPLRDAGNTPLSFSEFAPIRSAAVRQEDFALPAFSFYTGNEKGVQECIWMGTLDEVVALTHSVESSMTNIIRSSGDSDDDAAKDVEADFARFRTEIARVAEIGKPYRDILRLCGLESSFRERESVTAVCIDPKASKIAITKVDSHGVSSTLELGVDLG